MIAIESLTKRLSNENTLFVQNEAGFLAEVSFMWNNPASSEEIAHFEERNGIELPTSFKEFLKYSNGAILFKDSLYGQWGCNILGLEELTKMTSEAKSRGYDIGEECLVFATWFGDGDLLLFDLAKYHSQRKDYILDGDSGYQASDWDYIKGDFQQWLDRLIVSQGAKYWRWY